MRIGALISPLFLAAAATLAAPVAADPAAEAMLQTLLVSEDPDPDLFAPAFRQAIPMSDLDGILDDLRGLAGPPRAVRVDGERFEISTATHRLAGQIGLDAEGLIALLFFEPPEPRVEDLAEAVGALADLGQDVAWLALRNDEVLSAEGPDRPMAVGSAFKLGVMAVLLDEIAAGRRAWDEVVRLDDHHLSLPSGRLQDMPLGAPLTLHTLAALMISESDNTATDVLLDVLGSEPVAKALGIEYVLSTRAFFVLKADAGRRAAFKAAGPETRALLAAEATRASLPSVAEVATPYDADIEWLLPLDRLCALILKVADHPIMAINPGPLAHGDWASVAYKGGSEIGVLNLTAAMTDATEQRYCAALTINDPGLVDVNAASAAFRSMTRALAHER